MRRLVTQGGAVVLIGMLVAGCSSKEVKDFASWCDYIHDPKMGQYDIFSMDQPAVIKGLVAAWDQVIVENSAHVLGVPPESISTNGVTTELRKTRVIGAWRDADTLHLALTLIPSPILDRSRSDAQIFADGYSARLAAVARNDTRGKTDPMTRCLYGGVNIFFARVEIHASDGTASIRNDIFERLKKYN